MKTLQFKSIAILVFVAFAVACSNEKDEDNSLRLPSFEDNKITLLYPDGKGSIAIAGGVQPYSVHCDSEILKVYMDKDPNYFKYEVRGVGETPIKISDASGQSLVLDALIRYNEWSVEITEHSVSVEGDDMTIAAQNELKEKVLTSIPVKVGGGYKFIFTEKKAGTLYVYKERFGGEYSQGTFSVNYLDDMSREDWVYTLTFDGEEHNYLQCLLLRSRSTEPLVPFSFYEELTDEYKAEYPELESVIAYQHFLQ